jgi:hypothetical protein
MWDGVVLSLVLAVLQIVDPIWKPLWSGPFFFFKLALAIHFAWQGWAASIKPIFVTSARGVEVANGIGGKPVSGPWSEVTHLTWENSSAMCLARREAPGIVLSPSPLSRQRRTAFREPVHGYFKLRAAEPREAVT